MMPKLVGGETIKACALAALRTHVDCQTIGLALRGEIKSSRYTSLTIHSAAVSSPPKNLNAILLSQLWKPGLGGWASRAAVR